ncbi:MAG: conjugative transposon protein TraN [Bacteroidetes bacterium]|nr:conjugative transposon protein TraN [Bacteroidota bacterium]
MKKISAMGMGIFLLITIFKTQAQTNTTWQIKAIEPHHVAVAFSKTTNIIFPYSIVSVDIGSQDVLAQKAKGVENILQIKAAKENFPQTDISIITADGSLTSFLVDYAEQPAVLNLSLAIEEKKNSTCILSETFNEAEVQKYAKLASVSKEKINSVKDKRFGIRLQLNGLFIHDNIMYFRLNIANETNINYDIDQLRFYIRDQKKAKRTATQEIEINPLYVKGDTAVIVGQTERIFVYAVPKFTIPDKKYFVIELMEKNGGRYLQLHLKNKTIVKAVPIN